MAAGVRKRNAAQRRESAQKVEGDAKDKAEEKKGDPSQERKEGAAGGKRRFLLRLLLAIIMSASFSFLVLHNVFGPSIWRWNPSDKAHSSKSSTQTMPAKESAARLNATRHLRPSVRFPLASDARTTDNVDRLEDVERLDAVRQALLGSWSAYVEDAFGADEYHPISRSGSNFSIDGGVGYFIVDVIDLLLITGEQEEYRRARDWVAKLEWHDKRGKFSVFETTIRTLGGLLSAYALCTPGRPDTLSQRTSLLCDPTDAEMFLTKALNLAHLLKPAFESNSLGLPEREIDFASGKVFADADNQNLISLAEATTIQLEFKFLAHATDDESWWRLAERPMEILRRNAASGRLDGLQPIFLNPQTGVPSISEIRLGSRGDSYYEYLLKQYVQTNKTEVAYLDMYQQAMMGVKTHLLRQSPNRKLLHTTELQPRLNPQTRRAALHILPKQDHLVCFLGGSFMLGALHVQQSSPFVHSYALPYPPLKEKVGGLFATWNELSREDWIVGHELLKTCFETYNGTTTGLSPEIAMFRIRGDGYAGPEKDWFVKKPDETLEKRNQKLLGGGKKRLEPLIDARNILRPETVESLFIAFHLSGDPVYRQWGWTIFEAFQQHAHLRRQEHFEGAKDVHPGAFAGIKDVNARQAEHLDRMETFWLAETLKYLYLLFADQDTLRLDQWVLNTEAHPLPIFTPTMETNVL